MTREEFIRIKNKLRTFEFDKNSIRYTNISNNTHVDKYCLTNDFSRLIRELLFEGNERKAPKEFEYNILVLLEEGVFSDEEWCRIIPELDCYEFWSDVKELNKSVLPLFNKIVEYKKDISLEFWQGALSGKEKDLQPFWVNEDGVNAWRNGNKYCSIINKIKPYIVAFEKKYPGSISTLSEIYG